MKAIRSTTIIPNKNITRIILVTLLILLAPLVAMQFTDEVDWDLADFIVIGTLLLGTGFMYELAAKKTRNTNYRVAIGIVLVVALILVWVELAVGLFGTPFSGS